MNLLKKLPLEECFRVTMYAKFLKRSIDFVLSTLGIVFLALPMGVIALIIKITDPGPVFFKQKRVGRHGKEFYMYKFRTMRLNAEEILEQLKDKLAKNERPTKIRIVENLPMTSSGKVDKMKIKELFQGEENGQKVHFNHPYGR